VTQRNAICQRIVQPGYLLSLAMVKNCCVDQWGLIGRTGFGSVGLDFVDQFVCLALLRYFCRLQMARRLIQAGTLAIVAVLCFDFTVRVNAVWIVCAKYSCL